MRMTVGNQLRIQEPTADLLNWCKKNMVLANPDYAKKVRMHLWLGNTPQKLYLMQWDGDTLVLPYGCLNTVLRLGECEVINDLPAPKEVDFGCSVPLYDYQEAAKEAMLKAYYGILQSPAGSGKTQVGIAIAAALGRKTLWLTHTRDLLSQSKNRAEQYMSPSLTGTITEGRVQIGKAITFATVQTMCNLDLGRYRDVWDCIIVDECHRVAGTPTSVTQFSRVLNSLAARHKYGLSATVHRADGMIAATYALLGQIAYQVPDAAVAEKVMTVSVLPRPTHQGLSREFLDTDGTIIYAKLVNFLADRCDRNELIAADLVENRDHYNLILSDRLSHLEYLMKHLPRNLREQAVMVDGKMTSKKAKAMREQAIEDMRQGRKRYLFATYSLAKEGLDIPRLDRLYLATPQKDYAVITQSIGRIARTFEGKDEPVVYDYVDEGIQYLVRSYKKRCATYRKCGCKFIE
ncbi:MAG: DEAD/DEAH box helicase [Eubacteriales bacterium]